MLTEAQLDDIRARHLVTEVVADYGVTLRRNAGPCPICGGSKRNGRFEAVDGGRAWVCAVCQDGGDVIKLVMKVEGVDFKAAVERLGGGRAIDPAAQARLERERAQRREAQAREAEKYRQSERARCLAIWKQTQSAAGTPVEAHLNARAIFDVGAMRVRFSPQQAYFDGETVNEQGRREPRMVHRGPAMIVPILNAGAVFEGVHITWIDPERPGKKAEIFDPETGEALPAKKMRGRKLGGYIDAFPGGDPRRCYLGEGIETVASVREAMRDGAVYRVAGDLGNLAGRATETLPHPTLKHANGHAKRVPGPQPDLTSEACPVPDACAELILLKDGDSDPFLTDCALRRAALRHGRRGRRVRVADPGVGVDFNDLARAAL